MATLKHTQSADILFPEVDDEAAQFDRFARTRDSLGYGDASLDIRRHFRQRSHSQDVTGRPWYNCRKLSAGATPPPPRPPPPTKGEGLLSRTDSRRRTWSPPAFSRMMGSAGSAMRSYLSNDQLDGVPDENIYEELESVLGGISPCKLAPVSGKLTRQNAHRSLIKPVAFKPVLPPHCSTPKRLPPPTPHQMMMSSAASAASSHRSSSSSYSVHSSPGSSSCSAPPPSQPGPPPPHAASSPQLYSSARMPSLDDGYASQQDFMHDRPLAVTYVSDFHSHMEGAGSAAGSSKDMHAAASVVDSYVTTPSPSDSGVGEVEALIRVKEEELAKLRDTMERNEAAILQVHAERQQNWLMEMREVADEWERRLRAQQQKAFRSEQSLIMQLFRLQQERKQLKTNAEELRESRDALTREIAAVKRECDVLRSKADEASWELQQKAGEISLLKAQLKEAKEEASSRSSCLLELKNQLREGAQDKDARLAEICRLKAESERTQSELDAAKEIVQQTQRQLEVIRQNTAAPMDVLQLREELSAALSELASVKSENVKQKEQWLEEKNKVIRYQKHLQLNYTQMHRKNKMLESEIQQLTLELENRDIQLSDIQNDERQESMC